MSPQVLALGFVCNGKRSYLRDAWNILDFCIVLVSLVMLLGIPQLKPLRVLRALRPLRLVSRNPGMKLVVNSLLRAMPGVANVMSVQMLFMLIFGIVFFNIYFIRKCIARRKQKTVDDSKKLVHRYRR